MAKMLKMLQSFSPMVSKVFPSSKENLIRTENKLKQKELEIRKLQLEKEKKALKV